MTGLKKFGLGGFLAMLLQCGRTADAVWFAPENFLLGGGASTNGVAFAFRPKVPLLITALRYDFHPNASGFATSRVDLLNATGQILATARLDTNAAALGQDYQELQPPLMLPAGSTNFLRASILLEEPPPGVDYFWFGLVTPTDQITIAPELDYLGAGPGLNLNTYDQLNFHIGANFRFATIAPVNLQISLTSSNHVRLSWPATSGTYTLHTGPTPEAILTPVTQVPQLLGEEHVVTLPVSASNSFFRLIW